MVPFSPRRYLYHSYLAYMAEYGKEHIRKQCTKGPDKGRTISNVLLADDVETWLPAAMNNHTDKNY